MTPDTLPAAPQPGVEIPDHTPLTDPRIEAFCSDVARGLFHAFAYSADVWKTDPFDVESIHAGARRWFDRTVTRVVTPTELSTGRILLLLGESGSGKTHLMRAFRNRVHVQHRGYCGYMQMTAFTGQYGRYVLNNLIESLDKPYHQPESSESGLMRLSNALTRRLDGRGQEDLERLHEGGLDAETINQLVVSLADQIVVDDRFREIDVFLIQALLYLQYGDPRIKARVLMYLRCEDLTPADRRLLGGIVPRTYADAPHWMIQRLGQVMWAVDHVPLILCVDQLEDVFDLDEAAVKFRKAMATLCDVVSRLPSAIVVVSCLENFYDELKKLLTKPIQDRVENDPRPISLQTPCDRSEVERLIGLRLKHLFESRGAAFREEEPTFPFPENLIQRLVGLRARDVLLECQVYREHCIEEGKMAAYPMEVRSGSEHILAAEKPVTTLERAWSDHRAAAAMILPSSEEELAAILADAIADCSREQPASVSFRTRREGRFLFVEPQGAERTKQIVVAICNKAAQGGALGRQIEELLRQAGNRLATAVAVRSMDFRVGRKAAVAQLLRDLVEGGGRQVVVEDSDWRTMMAMAQFMCQQGQSPAFSEWRSQTRPLSGLNSLRAILQLEAAHEIAP